MIRQGPILVAALVAALVQFGSAMAADLPEPTVAAQAALADVCQPATEKSLAPRDLAMAKGFVREASPPDYVLKLFPISQMGRASFVEPVAGGALHVVSTVAPPPANPFSCLVILEAPAPGLVDAVKAHFSGPGTRYSNLPELTKGSPSAGLYSIGLNATNASKDVIDKIMVVSAPGSTAAWKAFIMTYRVDPASAAAGRNIEQMCQAGTAPAPLAPLCRKN